MPCPVVRCAPIHDLHPKYLWRHQRRWRWWCNRAGMALVSLALASASPPSPFLSPHLMSCTLGFGDFELWTMDHGWPSTPLSIVTTRPSPRNCLRPRCEIKPYKPDLTGIINNTQMNTHSFQRSTVEIVVQCTRTPPAMQFCPLGGRSSALVWCDWQIQTHLTGWIDQTTHVFPTEAASYVMG
jgi:hypothetical protein